MREPQLRTVTCASVRGLHRMAYWVWRSQAGEHSPTVLCVHGLTRNGRDFDALADRLSRTRHVICPDIIGRGRSDRAADPMLYVMPQYLADCVTLIARLDVERLTWIGTSMGGLLGMMLAAMPGHPVERLVLNDIGPVLTLDGRSRIAASIGDDPVFATRAAGVAELRERMRSFGPHTDEQFELLARHYVVPRGGQWAFHYDPAIAVPFRALAAQTVDLWPLYDAIDVPTLVLRGADSDLLDAATAAAMSRCGPRAREVVFPGVGHAPTLIDPAQIDAVESFLDEGNA